MSRVWDHSKASGGARLVLLAVADFCDDQGHAYPSVAALARKANLSERTAQYAIAELQAMGELCVKPSAGPHGTNLYTVTVGDFEPEGGAKSAPANKANRGAKSAPVQNLRGCNLRQGGVQSTTKGGADVCTRTVIEPSLEPSVDTPPLPPSSEATAEASPIGPVGPGESAPSRVSKKRVDPDSAARALVVAFRTVRHPRASEAIPAAEWDDCRKAARAMAADGITPEQVAAATQAALRRFSEPGMVNFRSVARHWSDLTEPDPPRVAGQRASQPTNATDARIARARALRDAADDDPLFRAADPPPAARPPLRIAGSGAHRSLPGGNP